MAIKTKWIRLDGYKDQIANYEFVLESADFDGRRVMVELHNKRHQDYAIMEDCEYKLYINGDLVDEDTGAPGGFGYGRTVTLSGEASIGDDYRYEFYSPYWHGDAINIDNWQGYLSFTGKVPEVEASINRASASPSPPIIEDIERGDLEVRYDVTNNSPFGTIYMDLSSSGPNGNIATEEVTLNVGSGSTDKVSISVGDIYTRNDTYQWDNGTYSFCLGETCANMDIVKGSSILDVDGIRLEPNMPAENENWNLAIDLSNNTSREINNVDVGVEIAGADSIADGSITTSVKPGYSKTVRISKPDIASVLGTDEVTKGDYTVCVS